MPKVRDLKERLLSTASVGESTNKNKMDISTPTVVQHHIHVEQTADGEFVGLPDEMKKMLKKLMTEDELKKKDNRETGKEVLLWNQEEQKRQQKEDV